VLKSFIALEWVVFTLLTAAFSISQCITPLVMGKLINNISYRETLQCLDFEF
jgi:hypothetical protein